MNYMCKQTPERFQFIIFDKTTKLCNPHPHPVLLAGVQLEPLKIVKN